MAGPTFLARGGGKVATGGLVSRHIQACEVSPRGSWTPCCAGLSGAGRLGSVAARNSCLVMVGDRLCEQQVW